MKRWMICFACLLLILSRCKSETLRIPITQSADRVCLVQIVDNREDLVIKEISSPETISELMHELAGLEIRRAWNDPPAKYGDFLIRLHFMDGGVEIIGLTAVGYLSEGTEEMDMWHYPDLDSFREILERYAGIKFDR